MNSEAVDHGVAGDVAAVAVALKQANTPEFKSYQQQVLANAKVMAKEMMDRGHTIVSGKEQSFVASMFQISFFTGERPSATVLVKFDLPLYWRNGTLPLYL